MSSVPDSPIPAADGHARKRGWTALFRTRAIFGLVAVLAMAGCGKKGPPLPPLVTLPAAPGDVTVRRVGSEIIVRFTIPAANTDGERPADIIRVDVYGHTGALSAPEDYVTRGMLVGTVTAKPPAPPDGQARPALQADAEGLDQGAVATVTEVLTRQLLVAAAPAAAQPLAANEVLAATMPTRYYAAVGVNRRGRRGAVSRVVGLPLVEPPPSPTEVTAVAEQAAVSVTWSPAPTADVAAARLAFNVYEVPEIPNRLADRASAAASSVPINPAPVTELSFKHPKTDWGRRRCYAVRTVSTVGDVPVESDASVPACVTPVDIFPPASPRSLAAVSSGESISLIWAANAENDLAGYLVLRGEAPGEKLAPLTPTPIRETTYRDMNVKPGVTYVYVVVAVDDAVRPNVSEPSNRVMEVLR